MSYLEAIKLSITFFPFLSFLFTIPFILCQYHKYGSINKFRVLIIYSFILYMITVYFLAIFPLPSKDSIDVAKSIGQIIPFKFIFDILKESDDFNGVLSIITSSSVYTVLLNILMFIPFGMYIRYYFKKSFSKTLFFSFLFSLFLEITQLTGLYFIYPHPYRLFDVDDLIINSLGGVIGYYIIGFLMKFLPSRNKIDYDSLEEGKHVSGFRRIVRFNLDFIIFLFFTSVLSSFLSGNSVFLLSMFIYYVMIPYVLDGQTIGGRFLKMKIVCPNKKLLRLFLRLCLFIFYYLTVPIGFSFICIQCLKYFNVSEILVFIFSGFLILVIGIFYLINLFWVFRRKMLFYDTLLKCEYVSTVYNFLDNKKDAN